MQDTELRNKNKDFIRKMKENDPTFFDELKKGQNPDYFILSCSDSRVSPSIITQMPLGRMFVHRNIANQVVNEDESFSASLYYAIKYLKVTKIIINGHTDCGGVKAASLMNDDNELQDWIIQVRTSLPHKNRLSEFSLDELTRYNIIKQIERIKEHRIYKLYGANIDVIGCLFHIESGELEIVNP
ncbi:carbonic anhydrase [Evansella cellulosilytica]|uniref:carbonic anhydrase n=1 Tax=Evansella cellulosilytica (strain ATCC 21833 / DSM 2522 / FERM P-1141 / JCM 9156 / N-4) TaxID=649639 RepID=E6TTF1_EVAC2|nr:carbonic anhydrase [Evansella cellulosilytica]ADU29587.1 carbonic anhydrase [Evansella cellulosilytica DSM 2522]